MTIGNIILILTSIIIAEFMFYVSILKINMRIDTLEEQIKKMEVEQTDEK